MKVIFRFRFNVFVSLTERQICPNMESDDEDIFLTQSTFRGDISSSDSDCIWNFGDKDFYCPITEDISEPEVLDTDTRTLAHVDHVVTEDVDADLETELAIAHEAEIFEAAEFLGVEEGEIKHAVKTAIDVRDMPDLGGPSRVSASKPWRIASENG